jgi:DNA-binding transcriptional LysR family regulator
MRFDLIDLRLFLHVLEAGSITRGAMLANMALPSASARLRGMEDAVGLPLLERRARGVRPTAAGDALTHHARIVLAQIERMEADLGEYATGRKGAIRLLTNTAAMMEFLPDALSPYLARRRNVAVDVKERPSTDIVTAIAGGETMSEGDGDSVDPVDRPLGQASAGAVCPRSPSPAAART